MFDILIIGSGGAGLSTALSAYSENLKIGVVSKFYPNNSQTAMAQGGINASISNEDSIASHIADTLKSSKGLGEIDVIEYACTKAPEIIEWLDSIGTPFSRDDEGVAQRKLGGASHKRACYAEDYTGLKILHTLIDKAINSNIEFLNDKFLLDLIVENSRVIGVKLLNIETSEVEVIGAKSVVLATGGYSKLYGKNSTNGDGMVGDGIATALRAGAKLSDMEFIQFHPTSLKSSSILISESARGEGGVLINSNGERFIDELATRDEVARAIFLEYQNDREVFLDLTKLDENFLKENLPQEIKLAKIYEGVDAFNEPIPIKPSAHYSIGGIDVDIDCKTNIDGLFAVGECANVKMHGANRLGGNSLLEIIAFGKRAGEKSREYIKDIDFVEIEEKSDIENIFAKETKKSFYEEKHKIEAILYNKVGVFRDEEGLKEALNYIENINIDEFGIKDKSKTFNTELIEFLEFKNMVEVSKAVIKSALFRKESRGAHFRNDYENSDEKFLGHTLFDGEKIYLQN